jgi:hypothetical protein
METKKLKIDTSNITVSDNLPYFNLDSPHIKEQVARLEKVVKNIKLPVVSK